MPSLRRFALLLTVPVLACLPAHSDTLDYVISGTEYGQITGQILSNPTPISYDANGFVIVLNFPMFVEAGGIYDNVVDSFTADGFSALQLAVGGASAAFWTGPTSAPQFLPGTYTFHDLDFGNTDRVITLVLTDPTRSATPTPEPSVLLLFGTGALGLMGALRSKFHTSKR